MSNLCGEYLDLGRVSDFLFYVLQKVEQHLKCFFFRISNCIRFSFSHSLSFVFFLLVIFVFFSDHRQEKKERERKTINRLCHSDISKMMFDNVLIRYLFILLLLLVLVQLTVSQTGPQDIQSSGMLIVLFDKFHKRTKIQVEVFFSYVWIYMERQMFWICLFEFYRTIVNFRAGIIRRMLMF